MEADKYKAIKQQLQAEQSKLTKQIEEHRGQICDWEEELSQITSAQEALSGKTAASSRRESCQEEKGERPGRQ